MKFVYLVRFSFSALLNNILFKKETKLIVISLYKICMRIYYLFCLYLFAPSHSLFFCLFLSMSAFCFAFSLFRFCCANICRKL